MSAGHVAYLLTAFPTVSETFVEGEFRALQGRGIPIDLYATRNFRESALPEDRASDRGLDVFRSPYILSWGVAASLFRTLLRRPVRTLGAFLTVLAGNLASPRYLLHAVALFPKTLVFAERMEKRRTVHVHATWGHYPATCAYVASRLLGVSFSFSAHAGLDVTGNTTFQSFKVRRARFVLVCNEANRQFLCRRNPDSANRIRTVYHGVDLHRIPAPGSLPKAQPPEIVAVGRLAPEKGFRDLLAASEILHDRGMPFRLRIFGEGPERATLQREIAARRLGDFAVLEGIAPHGSVLEAFAGATIVTLASYRSSQGFVDGIPNVLVEAMACGTPVVSTDYPGARELLQEGAAGMLVPQRDPSALAGALEDLLKDSKRRVLFVARGRRRVEEAFDRTRNIEAIVGLLRSVLDPRSPGTLGMTSRTLPPSEY